MLFCVPAIAAVLLMQCYMRSFPTGLLPVSGLRLFLVYLLLLPYLLVLAFRLLLEFLLLFGFTSSFPAIAGFRSDPILTSLLLLAAIRFFVYLLVYTLFCLFVDIQACRGYILKEAQAFCCRLLRLLVFSHETQPPANLSLLRKEERGRLCPLIWILNFLKVLSSEMDPAEIRLIL
jgi:hypothetical protein